MNHSPEPWKVEKGGAGNPSEAWEIGIVRDASGEEIYSIYDTADGMQLPFSDMERIVACVNFCQHMDTDAIVRLTKEGIGPETVFRLLDIHEWSRDSDGDKYCRECRTVDEHQPDCLLAKALKAWGGKP